MPITWRSASEQVALSVEAELRRMSEWPVGTAPHATRLFAIDPNGIVLTGVRNPIAPVDDLPVSVPPPRRFNVIVCGAAAAIADIMLTQGSRLVERCLPKHEPLLQLCVAPFPESASQIRSGIDNALLFLQDAHTTIDAIVWYDIHHHALRAEVRQLRAAASRRAAPILVLRPFDALGHAARELASVSGGHLMAPSADLYVELRRMIEGGHDSDPDDVLRSLS